MYTDRPEAAFYNLFWKRLMADTFHDQLSPDLYPNGDTYWEDVIYFLLKDPQNAWWDDRSTADKVETRDDILAKALQEAYSDGLSKLGKDFSAWKWGDLHTITFRNATLGKSGISLIENIFNRGPYPGQREHDQRAEDLLGRKRTIHSRRFASRRCAR